MWKEKNMKKPTIKDKVEQILMKNGCVSNFECIDSRLTTRLSDVILHLKTEGWEFDEEKSGYIGDSKNWRYVAKKSPYKVIRRTLPDGRVLEEITR
jgi:hypothetical protein